MFLKWVVNKHSLLYIIQSVFSLIVLLRKKKKLIFYMNHPVRNRHIAIRIAQIFHSLSFNTGEHEASSRFFVPTRFVLK